MNKVVYCPANAFDCPYYDANGCCMMYPESDPKEECDDFFYYWDGEEYIVDPKEDFEENA